MTLDTLKLVLGLNAPRTVLIIEDKVSFALRLRAVLEKLGHRVHSYSGVESFAGQLTGIDPHHPDDPSELNLSDYQVCFLDHYFAGDEFNGTSLTPLLVEKGIRVCGMSSVDSANESMRRRGAITSMRKDLLDQLLTL